MRAYAIKAKPTRYNGINYRSVLEAKWAMFFDRIGWKYQYEPCEINGRVPDFIVKCTSDSYSADRLLIEVKPSPLMGEDFISSIHMTYYNTRSHVLILNEMPFLKDEDSDNVVIGIGSQFYGGEIILRTDMMNFSMKGLSEICAPDMMWDGMIKGTIDRKYFTYNNDEEHKELLQTWKDCQNALQFKSY